jgi:tight adherence protein B
MASVFGIVLILAIVAAGVCGALALPVVVAQGLQIVRRSQLQTRVAGVGEGRAAAFEALGRSGIPVLRPLSRLLLRVGWVRKKCECCVQALGIKGSVVGVEGLCECLLVGLGLVSALIFLLTGMLVAALVVPVLVAVFAFGKAQKLLEKWGERLVEQIPDALRSLGICFNAGYSLQQAFEQTAHDTPAPLGAEMQQASYDVSAGRSIEEALAALEKRTKAADLRFAVIALEIQHRTGGSLQELLESAADAVIASADLRRQLAVQTAQAQLSAKVVTILPLVLVAVLSLAMEGYLQTFFSTPEGFTILLVALGMEAIGVVAIRRILGVGLD